MEMRLPDIGDFSDVPVIEVHVAPGDQLTVDDPVVTLESDKATMDVPASEAGVVSEVRVNVGDTVSEGDVLLTYEAAGPGAGAGEGGGAFGSGIFDGACA
jgi:pyruvate/2-oxoglutarate dehydrogenase complex dihydrolipoamide acyltransferase (E2) component